MFAVLGFWGFLGVFYDLISIFFAFVFLIGVGVILYELCQSNNLKSKSMLSFLPIGNVYIMSLLLGERIPNKIRNYLWVWYGVLYIIGLFISQISFASFLIVCYLMFLFLVEFYGLENKKRFVIHFALAVLTSGLSFIYSAYKFRNNVIVINEESIAMNNITFKEKINKGLEMLLESSKEDDDTENVSNPNLNNNIKSNSNSKSKNRKNKNTTNTNTNTNINNNSESESFVNDSFDIFAEDFGNRSVENNNNYDYNNNNRANNVDSSHNRTGINL